jgi:hypothetical protein
LVNFYPCTQPHIWSSKFCSHTKSCLLHLKSQHQTSLHNLPMLMIFWSACVETEYNLGSLSNKYFYNKNDSASWLSIFNTSKFLGSRNKLEFFLP